jgi:hypothetical protein
MAFFTSAGTWSIVTFLCASCAPAAGLPPARSSPTILLRMS